MNVTVGPCARCGSTEPSHVCMGPIDITTIEGARVRGQPGTSLDRVMAAFDIITQEVLPSAWMRGVTSHHGSNEPPEHDVEFSYGDDRPEGAGWVPLYRLRKLEPSQSDRGAE